MRQVNEKSMPLLGRFPGFARPAPAKKETLLAQGLPVDQSNGVSAQPVSEADASFGKANRL